MDSAQQDTTDTKTKSLLELNLPEFLEIPEEHEEKFMKQAIQIIYGMFIEELAIENEQIYEQIKEVEGGFSSFNDLFEYLATHYNEKEYSDALRKAVLKYKEETVRSFFDKYLKLNSVSTELSDDINEAIDKQNIELLEEYKDVVLQKV